MRTLRPGMWSKYLRDLQQPSGRLIFASADWANGWRGFIDGAIEQGLDAGRRVKALLTEWKVARSPQKRSLHTLVHSRLSILLVSYRDLIRLEVNLCP